VSGIIEARVCYSPKTQGAARSAQEAAESTRSVCGVLGIEGSPRFLYAAAFFDLLARVAERIAEDPPRLDFTVSTHVRPRFATPRYIETEDPSEGTALATAEAADWAEAYLAAHLRAFERLQGAHKAGRDSEAFQRAEEAVRHARASGRALQTLSARTAELAERVDERQQAPSRGREGRPQLTDINDKALAVLFRGGLRIRDLENVLQGTRLEDADGATDRLRLSSSAFGEFASAMARWEPTPPSELSLRNVPAG
jgi:hypothetical protein